MSARTYYLSLRFEAYSPGYQPLSQQRQLSTECDGFSGESAFAQVLHHRRHLSSVHTGVGEALQTSQRLFKLRGKSFLPIESRPCSSAPSFPQLTHRSLRAASLCLRQGRKSCIVVVARVLSQGASPCKKRR